MLLIYRVLVLEMIRGRHIHVPKRSKEETEYVGRRGAFRVEPEKNNDDYWWDSKRQVLMLEGYDLPPNPKYQNKPVWDLETLADTHPEEVKRLFWQCEWEGYGKYSGKHEPLSEQACKLIEMACYGRGICKKGEGEYRQIFKKSHPIKSIEEKGIPKV